MLTESRWMVSKDHFWGKKINIYNDKKWQLFLERLRDKVQE